MTSRGATLTMAAVLAVGLAGGASQLQVPYVGLGPGPVTDTLGTKDGKPLIDITGRTTYATSGHLDLTTVNVYPELDLLTAIQYWFDRTRAVVPREVVYPPEQTQEQSDQQNRREMQESQQHAVTAALRELEIPVKTELTITEVVARSPAQEAGIEVGDVIRSVDGVRVDSQEKLQEVISRHRPGEQVRVVSVHADRRRVVQVTTRPDPENAARAVIGVRAAPRYVYPFSVTIRLEDVGGPSAGLMFALGIVDLLTPGGMTGGKHIAGTGTIDDEGKVGPIGGIQQKLVAAKQAGAGWFLVPAGNWASAREARPKGLQLVKVGNLHEAIAAVRRIAAS